MIRVVPDANILISAMLGFSGPPRQVFNLALRKEVVLYGSQETYEEFCEKVIETKRLKKYWAKQIFTPEKIILDYKSAVNMVDTRGVYEGLEIVKDDPDDEVYFKAAKASGSKIIISGDKHLLNIKKYDSAIVVKPSYFIEKYISLTRRSS